MDVWTRQHGFLLSVAFGALGLIGLDTTSRSSPLLATSIFPSVTPMAGRGPAVSYAVAVAFSVAAAVAASRTVRHLAALSCVMKIRDPKRISSGPRP